MSIKSEIKKIISERGIGYLRYFSKFLKKVNPHQYWQIINRTKFLQKPLSFSERIYCVLNNIKKIPLCKQCKKKTVGFWDISMGYHTYCSKKCKGLSKEVNAKIEKTMLSRYGVSRTFRLKKWIKKAHRILRKNMLKKDYPSKLRKKLLKRERTNLLRYGDKIPMNCKSIQKKKEKTTMERYGVKHNSQSKECQEKMKQTNLKRYGYESAMQNKDVIDKARQTKIKNGTNPCVFPSVGKNEKKILDKQEKIDKCKIDRKFVILNFKPDGYCHKTNTIYEVYERKHRYTQQKKYDRKRRNKIIRKLKCGFIILWDLTR
jgi:hypothetical protein